jgi:5-methylcytosine-specific restriction endonuclease McrA
MTRTQWSSRTGRESRWIARRERLAIYIRDRWSCAYCGADLSGVQPHEMGLDHLRPQCRGGSHEATNLVTACRRCNSARQDRPWWQYATAGAADRIRRLRRRTMNLDLAQAILDGDAEWGDC